MKTIYACVCICTFILISSCRKDYSASTVNLTISNEGGTVLVSKGATIVLTLVNQGSDDGYLMNPPQCDSTVLKLTSHVYTPAASGTTGALGTDTWHFTALNDGVSGLIISETKATSTIIEFTGNIDVK